MLDLCYDSLAGLSVGDALGAQFFMPGRLIADLAAGRLPPGPWEWTDDTEMACSIVAQLRDGNAIDQDALAMSFAERAEPYRGYGPGAVVLLHRIRDGVPWRTAAARLFNGQGSCGNGAAMRVAPLGAYLAHDAELAARWAAQTAQVTHAHPEGVAGAVAVAVAAAHAAAGRDSGRGSGRPPAERLLSIVDEALVDGEVRDGVRRARELLGRDPAEAAYELGNGSRVTAQDTVPFCLWAAATMLDDYPTAIRTCVQAGGDIDTTSAIVGGIVAAYTGVATGGGVPADWLAAREPLPPWAAPVDGGQPTPRSE